MNSCKLSLSTHGVVIVNNNGMDQLNISTSISALSCGIITIKWIVNIKQESAFHLLKDRKMIPAVQFEKFFQKPNVLFRASTAFFSHSSRTRDMICVQSNLTTILKILTFYCIYTVVFGRRFQSNRKRPETLSMILSNFSLLIARYLFLVLASNRFKYIILN